MTILNFFPEIKFSIVFNKKTEDFLQQGDVHDLIEGYVTKYNELIDSSPILSRKFNHTGADELSNNLSSNGFFEASHSINLSEGDSSQKSLSAEGLSQIIRDEKTCT